MKKHKLSSSSAIRTSIGTRLTLSVGLIVSITIFVLFLSIYNNEKEQHIQQLHTQAEALLSEMTLLREWISSYHGVWTQTPGDYYLDQQDGYYQKSPAMVTKELSTLSNDKRLYSFHITSLKLTNPENVPDDFEHSALEQFEIDAEPVASLDQSGAEPLYRLMIPLKVQESCLECHGTQGYKEGDIRGGLSVFVPTSEMDASLTQSRKMLTLSAIGLVGVVMLFLYIMIRRMVILPVSELKDIALAVGNGNYNARCNLNTGNELEVFGKTLNQMVANLQKSQNTLEEKVKQRTEELNTISEVALIISQTGALDDILQEALEKVVNASGAGGGLVKIYEDNGTRLAAHFGLSETIQICFQGTEKRCNYNDEERAVRVSAIQEGVCKTLYPGKICQHPQECQARAAGYTRLASLLLRSRSRSLGTMLLFSKKEESFTAETMQLLESISSQLGIAIENANYRQRVEEIAVLEERTRISHELHDSLAQTLGWLSIKTELLEEDLKDGNTQESQQEMKVIRDVVKDACYDVRESIDGLRTQPTGDLKLTTASWVAEFRQRSGLNIEFQTNDTPIPLSPRVEIELLRILQEALTNVRKHAQATHVHITLQQDETHVFLKIEDNGSGFDYNEPVKEKHFGIKIMQERAENLGGTFKIDSKPDEGTRVSARLPLYPTL